MKIMPTRNGRLALLGVALGSLAGCGGTQRQVQVQGAKYNLNGDEASFADLYSQQEPLQAPPDVRCQYWTTRSRDADQGHWVGTKQLPASHFVNLVAWVQAKRSEVCEASSIASPQAQIQAAPTQLQAETAPPTPGTTASSNPASATLAKASAAVKACLDSQYGPNVAGGGAQCAKVEFCREQCAGAPGKLLRLAHFQALDLDACRVSSSSEEFKTACRPVMRFVSKADPYKIAVYGVQFSESGRNGGDDQYIYRAQEAILASQCALVLEGSTSCDSLSFLVQSGGWGVCGISKSCSSRETTDYLMSPEERAQLAAVVNAAQPKLAEARKAETATPAQCHAHVQSMKKHVVEANIDYAQAQGAVKASVCFRKCTYFESDADCLDHCGMEGRPTPALADAFIDGFWLDSHHCKCDDSGKCK